MNSAGLITVRSDSTRLPRKCFLEFPNRTVLEHNILRARHFGIRPIVCTTNEKSDNEVVEIAKKLEVEYFRGPSQNKMLRWLLCSENFGLNSFHTLDCDDPFIDFSLVTKSLAMLNDDELDYVKPSSRSSAGAATVGYSIDTDFLSLCLKDFMEDADTEMIEPILERVVKAEYKEVEEPETNQIRLTLDYLEDWVLIYFLESKCGVTGTRQEIDDYLRQHPNLNKINWFRNNEWRDRQLKISETIKERGNQ